MVPSGFLKAGLSAAIESSVPPRRTPSSVSMTVPSSSLTRVIWPAKRPWSMAAAAFACEASEYSSSWVRVNPRLAADRGAHRDPAHRLDAARHHHVVLAADEAGGGEVDRLLAGAALPVDGHPGHRQRPAGREHGVAGDVEGLLADLADAAPNDVVHHLRVHPGPLGEGVEH